MVTLDTNNRTINRDNSIRRPVRSINKLDSFTKQESFVKLVYVNLFKSFFKTISVIHESLHDGYFYDSDLVIIIMCFYL